MTEMLVTPQALLNTLLLLALAVGILVWVQHGNWPDTIIRRKRGPRGKDGKKIPIRVEDDPREPPG